MSLTTGRGPLSSRRAGRFSAPVPEGVAYIEPFRRRVRAIKNGETLIDSERVVLVHRPGRPPVYAFPIGDVRGTARADDPDGKENGTGGRLAVVPEPDTPGYVTVEWDGVDAWFEEDEEVFGHPRNPYHRIDCLHSGRKLRVEAHDATLVDCASTLVVYETALEPRLYVDASYVRMDLLRPSATQTYCPYKGTATYWSAQIGQEQVADVAWSYEDPLPESLPLRGFLSFDEARVTVCHDLPDPAELREPEFGHR
jgi:uncharacterized protein (DUF427 family)